MTETSYHGTLPSFWKEMGCSFLIEEIQFTEGENLGFELKSSHESLTSVEA